MPPGAANITVVVRVRPLSQKEVTRGAFPTLEVRDGTEIDVMDPDDKMGGLDYLRMDKSKDRSYAFDHAMEPGITQKQAFEQTTSEMLPDVMQVELCAPVAALSVPVPVAVAVRGLAVEPVPVPMPVPVPVPVPVPAAGVDA